MLLPGRPTKAKAYPKVAPLGQAPAILINTVIVWKSLPDIIWNVFVPGKHSLIFSGKASVYPKGEHLKDALLGQATALLINIIMVWYPIWKVLVTRKPKHLQDRPEFILKVSSIWSGYSFTNNIIMVWKGLQVIDILSYLESVSN